jgi:hypothetical protein
MYQIAYHYRTGDSFHTEDREERLEYEWEDLNTAREALKRIKEHYQWYKGIEDTFRDEVPKPDWLSVDSSMVSESSIHYLLNIPMDNGEEVQFWAPWCGYFEELYGARIILGGRDPSAV